MDASVVFGVIVILVASLIAAVWTRLRKIDTQPDRLGSPPGEEVLTRAVEIPAAVEAVTAADVVGMAGTEAAAVKQPLSRA